MAAKPKAAATKKPVAAKKTTVTSKPSASKKPPVTATKVAAKKAPVSKKAPPPAKKPLAKPKKPVLAVPKGYHSITPYMIVNNAAKAIEFYSKAFGAKLVMKMDKSGGKIGHAEIAIGDAKVMLADECPEMNARAPQAYGGSPMSLHFYTKNVDNVVKNAVAAGAKLIMPVQDMFYGDRSGAVEDPFGHAWHIATHIEDVSPATLKKRAAEAYAKKA